LIYLLDTNVISGVIRARQPDLHARLFRALTSGATVVISAVVTFELYYGVARSGNPERQSERLRLFLNRFGDPLPFIAEDAEIAGDVRHYLSARGEIIGPYDLLIAAQALRLQATLVTANVREFARVPGLEWEDWSTPLT
jgi:tRNA(fMet)-specific endonuclease VapC